MVGRPVVAVLKRHKHTVLIVLDGDRVGEDVDVRVDVDAPAVTGRMTDWERLCHSCAFRT
jgi:hypothetical protein